MTTLRHQRGVTLIELMVSLAVGLVLCLAVFATMSVTEGRRRASTSVNDVGQTGNYAMYAIDKWVRGAGSGFAAAAQHTYGCPLHAALADGTQLLPLNTLPAPFAGLNALMPNNFRLAPVIIVPGATTPAVSTQVSDALIVMNGSTGRSALAIDFTSPPDAAMLHVGNSLNFGAGDMLLLGDKQSGATGPQKCMLTSVGSTLAATGLVQDIPLGGAYYQATINSHSVTSFSGDGIALHLGQAGTPPSFMVLGVGDYNTLFSYDLLQPAASALTPVADGILEMHALYGVDTTGDDRIDGWVNPPASGNYSVASLTNGTPAAVALLESIKAIRVGLILRTQLPEKTEVTGTDATPTLFADLGTTLQYQRAFVANSNERNFRYRVMEQTIPVRNALLP